MVTAEVCLGGGALVKACLQPLATMVTSHHLSDDRNLVVKGLATQMKRVSDTLEDSRAEIRT